MYRTLTQAALSAALATFAFAQTPQTARIVTPTDTAQSFRGILMDASCQAIQNRPTTSGSAAKTAPSAGARDTEQSAATAHATGVGGAASATASGAGASGSLNNTTNTGGTAGNSATTTATTGVAKDQSGQATATSKSTEPADSRTTASASGPAASGSSSVTTYSGAGAATTGERSRSMDSTGAGAQWTIVREKYKDCKVTSNTSSFALMSNGQLYRIDDPNGTLHEQASSNTGRDDWHSVTLMGNIQGDHISVSSIQ